MSDSRREFLKKSMLLSGATGLSTILPASIQRALAIDPAPGSTFLDAEHIVILMQENRSFDHCFGALQGVRGFNDPRAISLPDKKPVWLQTNEKGETYAPFRLDMKDTKITWMGSLPHSRASQVDAYNEGKYDNWLIAKRPGNKQYAGMPLTLGYYTREDLPFNYAMADAFTVCDQNFCSAMTSTTPNRSFFWTGKITHQWDGIEKAHIRNDDFSFAKLDWGTFPEQLEKNNVKWKFYQNELSCGGGWKGEEKSWLANFGCNLLEFFAPYNVKFSERYITGLQKLVDTLPDEINKLQEESPSSEETANKNKAAIAKKQAALDNARAELAKWNKEAFDKLTPEQKKLYENAFVVNAGDPGYRSVTKLQYKDGNKEREVTVPSGDVLHQFRKDVNEGKLPTVSWLASPQNFSDHPSAPWYGAWYVSEVLDILTKNPEVWKKTIFIVTYDENDGYYDHVPPFSIPDNNKPGTGKVSTGIDTEVEHVRLANELKQGVPEMQAREAPIGLGFRVPMIIASPWSRGGKVCSQVFEHTSTLQFLETFINKKYNKNIRHENISRWRRAISGDLTSVFSPFDGSSPKPLPFLNRDKFVQDIFNAKFKSEPTGFAELTPSEIAAAIKSPSNIAARQEKGVRPAAALPYELYADGQWDAAQQRFVINMAAGKQLFGERSAGSPFTVYCPGAFTDEDGRTDTCRNWQFAVEKGDKLNYSWPVKGFSNEIYELRLHGPNGFFREFKGSAKDPQLDIRCAYPSDVKKQAGLSLNMNAAEALTIVIKDNAYGQKDISRSLVKGAAETLILPLTKSSGWYDFTIKIKGIKDFEQRFAGRVETGTDSITDPQMAG
ncbi:phospholipase C, phosphocholine-specific [Chitinophaga horti]|uniref:phospholipase C n=1 Tax=Chitinophaga horti TaxID=2920382 RepID=A0ABY6IUD3_9BACT|nr:phospholipase C, phosphocholine-specific [Chitinophaga horti]UYQ90981.1 phospholipase C, phosphocholine-specific [Chitinophaga horti]